MAPRPNCSIYCVVPGCGNTLKRYNTLKHSPCLTGVHYDSTNAECGCLGICKFHPFPKDVGTQILWKHLVGKPAMEINNDTRICSRHFQFEPLKPSTIPTLHMKPKNKNITVEIFPVNLGRKRSVVFEQDQVACTSNAVDYHFLYPQQGVLMVARTSSLTHPHGCFKRIRELEDENYNLKKRNRSLQNLLEKVSRRPSSNNTRVPRSPSVSIFKVEPDTI